MRAMAVEVSCVGSKSCSLKFLALLGASTSFGSLFTLGEASNHHKIRGSKVMNDTHGANALEKTEGHHFVFRRRQLKLEPK